MISKIMPAARAFYYTCRYVCKDENRARILDSEGVRDYGYKQMANDFKSQSDMRPDKEKAVFHSIISFSPQEKPSDQLMVAIARQYLERVGMKNTQFVVTRHLDTAHPHMHIVANRVNNQGKSIDERWIGFRAKQITQQLTKEYKLQPAIRKNLDITNQVQCNESEARKYQIYDIITKALPHCTSFKQLETRLEKKGIDIQYRYKEGTDVGPGERQGISFRLEKECFKGSKIDREFSFKNLERILSEQARKQEEKQELRHSFGGRQNGLKL